MLIKIIFSFTIVFFYFSLQGQEKNIYIEYENKLVSMQETTGILIAGKSNAKYTENPSAKKGEMSIEKSLDGHAAVYKPEVKESHFYKTKGLPVIYYTEYVVREKTPYYVYDSIPKLNWELIPNQTDTIQGYVCNKAKLKFRGSNLTAYYAPNLLFSFGPWKFDGLPGLILKISDDENPNKIYWEAKKIVYPYKKIAHLLPEKKKYDMSLKEFKIMSYKIYEEQGKRMNTIIMNDAAKEGVHVRIGDRPKINKRPNMVEKIYEWEKEGDIWLFYIDYLKKHPTYKINNS